MVSPRLIIAIILCAGTASGRHTLCPQESSALADWLTSHPEYRAATSADCACAEDIRKVRAGWGGVPAVPDYDPYRVVGDFNKDGLEDAAVVVVKRSNPLHGFGLLVFNGNRKGSPYSLAFSKMGLDLQGNGLFFGPPAGENLLLLGRFYSDDGVVVTPKKETYTLSQ